MLRTNIHFLSFIEKLYEEQSQSEILLRNHPKGTFLCTQDEAHYKVSIIKDGLAKCFYSDENGKDFIFEFLGKGEIIGEIEALRGLNCLCNVEAVSDIQVFTFSTSFFKHLINAEHQFSNILLDELADRVINTSSRAAYQQLNTLKYALPRLIDWQNKQGLQLSKADMASYLGIDIRSLNRALKDLNL